MSSATQAPRRVHVYRLSTGASAARWDAGHLERDPRTGRWSWSNDPGPEDAPDDGWLGFWTPTFVDAHTHLGDAFIRPERDELPRDLHALVAPPDGIKHQRLRQADPATVRDAMAARLDLMHRQGTDLHLDFREGGRQGLELLVDAASDTACVSLTLARPDADAHAAPDLWGQQLRDLLLPRKGAPPANGIGLSAMTDLPRACLDDAAAVAAKFHRPLAIHASERLREPVDDLLSIDPALVVHLCHATQNDLAALVAPRRLLVLCPTSNAFFGQPTPVADVHAMAEDHDALAGFGTDNAMLGDGDLVDELRAASSSAPRADLAWLLESATVSPRTWLMRQGFDLRGGEPVVARDGHASGGLLWMVKPAAAHDGFRNPPDEVKGTLARRLFQSREEAAGIGVLRARLPSDGSAS